MEADKCPNCGKEMTSYQNFCGFCGYSRNISLNLTPNQPQGNAVLFGSNGAQQRSTANHGTKLLAAFMVISLIAVGGMLVVALNDFSTLDDQLSLQYEHNLKTIIYLDGMKTNLTLTHLFLTKYVNEIQGTILLQDPAEDLQAMHSNSFEFTQKISVYREDYILSANPELMVLLQTTDNPDLSSQEISLLDALSSKWLALMTDVDEILHLSFRTPLSMANQTLIFQRMSDVSGNFTKAEGSLDDIVGIRGEVSKIANDEAQRVYGDISGRMIIYSAFISAVLVVFLIAGLIEMRRRSLKKP